MSSFEVKSFASLCFDILHQVFISFDRYLYDNAVLRLERNKPTSISSRILKGIRTHYIFFMFKELQNTENKFPYCRFLRALTFKRP